MLRNYCYDKYLSDRGWDRAGDKTDIDQVVKDINSASVRAYETDPTMTKDKYMFIKNGLIPYESEKQFPNAYNIWRDKFDNTTAYGVVHNEYYYWAPGLRTSGGLYEACIDRVDNYKTAESKGDVLYTQKN